MKRIFIVLQVLILCLALSACKRNGAGTVLTPTASQMPADPPPQEILGSWPPQTTASTEEYSLSFPITVADSRKLTLKLIGKKLTDEYNRYGIGCIQVFHGETLLQTIQVADAIIANWGDDTGFGGYTNCWDRDGGLSITDINFDGSEDIGLVGWITAGANIPSYYWIWNGEKEQFEYAFCLCNLTVDVENNQLISHTSGGLLLEQTSVYEYDADRVLQVVRQEIREVVPTDNDMAVTTRIYERRDGVLQMVALQNDPPPPDQVCDTWGRAD